ncbi:Protein MLP1 [Nakaseomyces bracarensis]|uniref:Protein MLP1 n=1 Tax=Nakaseomyces bracarensis TaxID=273131 RepID=A0ABR4NRE0_9SACH
MSAETDNLQIIGAFLNLESDKVEHLDQSLKDVLLSKVEEFSKLESDNLKVNVLLDELKSSSNERYEKLKQELDLLVKDNSEIREENKQLSQKVLSLENSDRRHGEEASMSANEISSLKSDIAELNAKNSRLQETLHGKNVEIEEVNKTKLTLIEENKIINQKLLESEMKCQSLQSDELSKKAEIERSSQEVLLLRKNQEWLEQELTNKNQHFLFYRKKTDMMVHDAVTNLEKIKSELKLEKANNELLNKKVTEFSNNLQVKLMENKDLKDILNVEKQEFEKEMKIKTKLISLYEDQIKTLESNIKNKLRSAEESEESSSEIVSQLKDELSATKSALQKAEERCLRLESLYDTTESNQATTNGLHDGSNLLDEFNSSTISSTTSKRIQSDMNILKRKLLQEKRQKEKLQQQVEAFVVELEHKIPVINSFQERTSALEKELTDTALLLEHTSKENELKSTEVKSLNKKVFDLEQNIGTLIRQRTDLAHQIQFLLINTSVAQDNSRLLSEEELKFIKNLITNDNMDALNDSQKVISDRLVKFKDIAELQERNNELLSAVRNLAQKLEDNEKQQRAGTENNIDEDSSIFAEAKEAILTLESANETLEKNLHLVTKERDAFKLLVSEGGQAKTNPDIFQEKYQELKIKSDNKISELEARLSQVTEDSSSHTKALTEEINELHKKISQLNIDLQKHRSAEYLAEERLKLVQNSMDLIKNENEQLRSRSQRLEESLSKQDEQTQKTFTSYIESVAKISSLETTLKNNQTEVSLLKSAKESLKTELANVNDEKSKLRVMLAQLQSVQNERESLLKETQENFKKRLSDLTKQNDDIEAKLNVKITEIQTAESEKKSQNEWYQNKIDELSSKFQLEHQAVLDKQNEIDGLSIKIKNIEKQYDELKIRLHTFETLNSTDNIDENNVREALEKAKIELSEAYSQLDDFKTLSQSSDDTLNELKSNYERKEFEINSKLKMITDDKNELEERFSILRQQLENVKNELDLQRERAETEKKSMTQKISELEGSSQSVEEVKQEYMDRLQKLQNDLEEQTVYANNAQKNYEQELQKHANVSKTISELREQNQKLKNDVQSLSSELLSITEKLSQKENTWNFERNELEKQNKLAQQRIDDVSKQNQLLYSQIDILNKAESMEDEEFEEGKEDNESTALLLSIRRERDILDTKLTVVENEKNSINKKLLDLEAELNMAKSDASNYRAKYEQHADIIRQYNRVKDELNNLDLLKESNTTLRNELKHVSDEKQKLSDELKKINEDILPMKSDLQNLQQVISEKDDMMKAVQEESQRWKIRLEEMIENHQKVNVDDYSKLENQLKEMENELENSRKENSELDERFNRLKKQAQERLKASKEQHSSLQSQISDLKKERDDLEAKMKEVAEKNSLTEAQISSLQEENKKIEDMRNELAEISTKNEELQRELDNKNEKSEQSTIELKDKINELNGIITNLKEELEVKQSTHVSEEDTKKVLDGMRHDLIEEKERFIAEKTEEFNNKLNAEIEKIKDEMKQMEKESAEPTVEPVDIEAIKKEWQDENEAIVQQRISEAEENLKKRIRLPTEEKIQKIIEKRKAELEQEFNEKIKEKAKELLLNDSNGEFNDEVREALAKEMKEKFEEDLQSARRKAFEEGKQQANMRTTLLERKVQKLESQLQNKDSSDADNESEAPKKISENHPIPDVPKFGNLGSGEKVLKPSSPFGAASQFNNPFTFGSKNIVSPFASAFAPTFKDFDTNGTTFTSGSSDNSPQKRPAQDNLENDDAKKARSDDENV